jgi:HipA-like protein
VSGGPTSGAGGATVAPGATASPGPSAPASGGASSAPSPQHELFLLPVDVKWCQPVNLGSADCSNICRGVDGFDYVIKDGVSGASVPQTPHCEWFCSQLGELIGIPSPPFRIVRQLDDTLVFGSRWEGGVIKPGSAPAMASARWWEKVKAGDIKLADIQGALSRIYAFDHFIHNVDRHQGNLLVREQYAGHVMLAFDYSRAWVFNGFPLPNLPMAVNNTVRWQRFFSKEWGSPYIDAAQVDVAIDSIRKIRPETINEILTKQPDTWLPNTLRSDILNWWGSSEMLVRLDGIAKGIADGTYL